jgi:hypothetical protein
VQYNSTNHLGVVLGCKGDVPMKFKSTDVWLPEKVGNNTYTSLKLLIENSYYAQDWWKLGKDGVDIGFDKEYCTIKICTARRSGHSTAICKVAYEYFDKAIFMSGSLDQAKCLKNKFCTYIYEIDPDIISKNTNSVLETKNGGRYIFGLHRNLDCYCGEDCEVVFVDGTYNLNPSKEKEIYERFGPVMWDKNHKQFFVFVQ